MFSRLFFENPAWLGTGVLFTQLILVYRWAKRRDPRSRYTLRAGLAMGALLMGTSVVVVTPGEEIIAACEDLARAVDDGNVAFIGSRLADAFQTEDVDRDTFLLRLQSALTRGRVDRPRLRRFEITFADPYHVVVALDATAQVRFAEGSAGRLPSRWRLAFRKSPDGWRLTSVQSVPVPPLNLRNLDPWLR